MAYREVTRDSWFSRIGNSFLGALVGLVLFVVAFPLLFWNEGRAVQTARSLEEGAASVVTVPADRVDPAFEGKLVHLSAEARTDQTLSDPEFGVSTNAIKLIREVEMYQWEEKKESETKKKLGGGTETVNTYRYRQTWSSRLIDSDSFKEGGHQNPGELPFESKTLIAHTVHFGAFQLSPEQVHQLDGAEALRVEKISNAGPGRVEGGALYVGRDSAAPAIGDVRVRFSVVKPGPVTVVARQQGESFVAYATRAGDEIDLVESGTLSSAQMFTAAQERNTVLTWVLRFCGWLAMFLGLKLAMRPISVLGDVVPFIGSMIGAGTTFFSFLIAASLSTVTVALAWVVYRPLLGIALLLAAGGMVFWLVKRSRNKQQPAARPPMARAA